MPIYEYECDKCGHEFEREQKMADAPVKTCPKCKARKVTKLISRSSFVLKGGGWYADGYSDAKKAEKKEDKKDGKKDEAAKETDSGSKPESGDDKKSSDKKSKSKKGKSGSSKKSAA
jgi:putative FmdB family regulatory protein